MHGLRAILRGGLLVLAVAAPVRTAAAQTTGADALIEEGILLRERGEDGAALKRFEQAHRQSGSHRALTQVALAEEALGRWVEAERHLSRALESPDAWIDRHRPLLERELTRIREHVGDLRVEVDAPGATLHVGNVQVPLPQAAPLRVAAGRVRIEVHAPGYEPVRRAVDVPGGGQWSERVELVPVAGHEDREPRRTTARTARPAPFAPASAEPASDRDQGASLRTWLWVALAAVAVGGGVTAAVVLTADRRDPAPEYAPSDIGGVVMTLGGR